MSNLIGLCDYHWIGPIAWWLSRESSEKAAWLQAGGSIAAVRIVFFVANRQQKKRQLEVEETNRKIVMSAAANLYTALSYQSTILQFAPKGDGKIGREMNFDEAVKFIRIQDRLKDALETIVDKSHYFSLELCEEIVKLSLNVAAYDRVVDQRARLTSLKDPDVFFQNIAGMTSDMSAKIVTLQSMLGPYLPSASS